MNPAPASHPGSGLRVLLVDDDPRVRAAMVAELTGAGWRPTAVGPRQLTEHHRADVATDFDVALVDVALPSVTEGLAMIADLAVRIPVVAFSINGAARDEALAAGAAAYREKDGDTDLLLRSLRAATTTATTARRPDKGGDRPDRPRSPR
jgi:CheY-like chemotaxis protein